MLSMFFKMSSNSYLFLVSAWYVMLFISESKKPSNLHIVIGVVASVLCLIFSIVVFFIWRRYFGHKSRREGMAKSIYIYIYIYSTFTQLIHKCVHETPKYFISAEQFVKHYYFLCFIYLFIFAQLLHRSYI